MEGTAKRQPIPKLAANVASTKDHPDILQRLRNTFRPSKEAAEKLKKCQDDMKKFPLKSFNECFTFKCTVGILATNFEEFVVKMEKILSLDKEAKERLLDGQYSEENTEKFTNFKCDNGKGEISHGRFITVKENGKLDVAYAAYTMNFELCEKDTEDWYYKYWFGVLPVSWEYKTKPHELSKDEKGKFEEWCEAKLCCSVAEQRKNLKR